MLVWPNTLQMKAAKFQLGSAFVVGGSNMLGWSQTGRYDGGGFWTLTADQIILTCREHHQAFRALQAALGGGDAPIEIHVPDWWVAPTLADFNVPDYVPFAGGGYFSDGTPFENGQITANTVLDADLRATSLTLDIGLAQLGGGERFHVIDEEGVKRLHQVKAVTAPEDTGGEWVISFRPPLRTDQAAGSVVDFNKPTGTYQLLPGDAGDDPMAHLVELGRWGQPAVTFVEWPGSDL